MTPLILAVFLTLLAGCGSDEPFVPTRIPAGEYERIVSLTPSVTEILFALGAGGRTRGVTTWCDYPPAARGLPRVGDFLKPNLEAIVSLDPDLVILAPTGDLLRESYDNLVRLGLDVLVVWNNTIDETLAAMLEIGRVLRLDDEAAALEARIRRELAAERERLSRAPRRRILWIMGRNPLVAVGEGTYQHELLEAAGCINAAAGLGSWPVLNSEFVFESDPDIIIDSSMDVPPPGDGSRAANPWERFQSLTAVKAGRVHFLNSDPVYRPGPRMAEGLAILGKTIHPDRGGE